MEIFFPNHCLFCDKVIDKEALFCSICWPKLQFITDPKCKICAYPFEVELKGKAANLPCAQCLKKKPSFDKVITIFRYNKIFRKIIADLKYRDATFIAKKFSKLLKEKIAPELDDIDFVTVVPLHINKLKKRKFNQVILLAKNSLTKNHKIKIYNDILFRAKDTPSQVDLTSKQRKENIKRAFILNKKYKDFIKDKKILLVDDVMTTGATIESCAKVLKKTGAKKVVILTLAKTVLNRF